MDRRGAVSSFPHEFMIHITLPRFRGSPAGTSGLGLTGQIPHVSKKTHGGYRREFARRLDVTPSILMIPEYPISVDERRKVHRYEGSKDSTIVTMHLTTSSKKLLVTWCITPGNSPEHALALEELL